VGAVEIMFSAFNTGPMSGRQLAIKDAKRGKVDSNSAALSRLLPVKGDWTVLGN
jgi:hypothetical protein